jgi:DNA-binding PadR family transcriptional regulator
MEGTVPMSRTEDGSYTPLTPAVFHILLALADGDLHGYGIMRAIEEVTSPSMKMGPGTVYGSLQRMEEAGLVEDCGSAQGGKRRLYGLTVLGRKSLQAESVRLARLAQMVRDKGLVPSEA